MIYIKNEKELEKMRESGRIMKLVLQAMKENIREGISTLELDKVATDVMKKHGAIPSFVGAECMFEEGKPFKHATCISINEEIIHGVPSASKILKNGDVVSVDVGVYKNGFHADAGRTFIVGEGTPTAKKLVKTAEQAFFAGIENAYPGKRIGDISNAIQQVVEKAGFNLLRGFEGHGVGRELHEEPGVPNYGKAGRGERLQAGMTLAIEPMIMAGKPDVVVAEDLWCIKTEDGSLTAYYENTIAITEEGPEILTL